MKCRICFWSPPWGRISIIDTPSVSRFIKGNPKPQDSPLYPEDAVREALINALAHRDYSAASGGVSIHVFPRRLEIWNSGPLPDGVTEENLPKGHISVAGPSHSGFRWSRWACIRDDLNPNPPIFYAGGIGAHGAGWDSAAMSGAHVKRPPVEWAVDFTTFKITRTQWATSMRAGVINRVKLSGHIEQGVSPALKLDRSALSWWEACDIGGVDELSSPQICGVRLGL